MKNSLFSKIVATGGYLPGNPVSNDKLIDDLSKYGVNTTSEWIKERSGIEFRHFSNKQMTFELAVEAAKNAINSSNIKCSDIDLIIVATTTPDRLFPSVACHVQKTLGIKHCPAFDVQAVCSGFVYALAISDMFIKSNKTKCALVIGSERLSRIINWKDRSTCVLFGDGAGAVIVKKSTEPGILNFSLNADGYQNDILNAPAYFDQGKIEGFPFIKMEGREVFKKAVDVLSKNALEILENSNVKPENINWYIPHQANIRIMNTVGKKLGVPSSKMIQTVNLHANTSAASIPLALNQGIIDGRIKKGDTVLLQGVGGGFTWGSILFVV